MVETNRLFLAIPRKVIVKLVGYQPIAWPVWKTEAVSILPFDNPNIEPYRLFYMNCASDGLVSFTEILSGQKYYSLENGGRKKRQYLSPSLASGDLVISEEDLISIYEIDVNFPPKMKASNAYEYACALAKVDYNKKPYSPFTRTFKKDKTKKAKYI